MGMKQILVIMVVLVGCGESSVDNANSKNAQSRVEARNIIERAVRIELKKPPKSILTESDFLKVTKLQFGYAAKITDEDLKDIAKLQKLKFIILSGTEITKSSAAELKKALPNCRIDGP